MNSVPSPRNLSKPGHPAKGACSRASCGCHSSARSLNRREFLRGLSLGAGLAVLEPWRAMAGPFTRKDFEKLVPADKKLRPEWLRSLTERGRRTVYHGADLDKIGMPIGGLCAGQLYLGGDGRLWHWDIFNRRISTAAEHYANPMKAISPIEQGFALRLKEQDRKVVRPLNRQHWREVSFCGEYPIGYVEYRDPDCPATVSLEAFSPFMPLDTADSSLPATIFEFTVKNTGRVPLELELGGWLQNAVCLHSAETRAGLRRNRLVRGSGFLMLECAAVASPAPQTTRPDILFDDFESDTYVNWAVEGTAFGNGPVEVAKIPDYQGDVGGKGQRVVNSHASAPGTTVETKDAATGTLRSKEFRIERNYITFLMGGGTHKAKTCMDLLVSGQVVRTATGQNNNRMRPVSWDVRPWAGQAAVLHIVDQESGGWGNIGVDDIVFSDQPREPLGPLAAEPDFGTLGLALFTEDSRGLSARPGSSEFGAASLPLDNLAEAACAEPKDSAAVATQPFGEKLVGSVARRMKLAPGASGKAAFILAWHFPNLKMDRLPPGRHYGTRFDSAVAVTEYVQKNFPRLAGQTRLWHDTWYDSTLPYWFLDRTFLNTSILATSTCHRFADGRFYGWEGVGCCEGTCGHVWQYAHAMARLFPDLERITREKIDFGLALQPNGAIHFRGEFNNIPAIDAQAGTILRALREHQMSPGPAFLERNWPRLKQAVDWLIAKDANADGLIESNQHNTLDTDWFGPVAWLSGLYQAALLAAETMALEVSDREFAARCRTILEVGRKKIVAELFNGEYFINKPDPKHLDAINSGSGCEIDQVFGQSWAFQVGLPRVLPEKETVSALKLLWRYNFTPDVGPYRERYRAGRWYAMPGEAGLLMCSFPRDDWDYEQAKGKGPDWAAGYFNECMNGFEYQAAGHMLWEGLVTEGLAVTRAVHDRYHPSRRNPWNEVECGDHYARSMASYGVFLAACGFEYHGPKGHLGFAPRLTPENFKTAFTAAEGWGTYTQMIEGRGRETEGTTFKCEIDLKWGKLLLRTLAFRLPESVRPKSVRITAHGKSVKSEFAVAGNRLTISLSQPVQLTPTAKLELRTT